MQSRRVTSIGHHLVVLSSGEEVIAALTAFAREHDLASARIEAIGVFSSARIGYLDHATGSYDEYAVDEPSEVLSLAGSIVGHDGAPEVHAHVSLGTADTTARGGHLISGRVHPTLEVFVEAFETPVSREHDDATGQDLIQLGR